MSPAAAMEADGLGGAQPAAAARREGADSVGASSAAGGPSSSGSSVSGSDATDDLFVDVLPEPDVARGKAGLGPAPKAGAAGDAAGRTLGGSREAAAAASPLTTPAEPPSAAEFAARGPVVATGHPALAGVQSIDGDASAAPPVPLGAPVPFETPLFQGHLLLAVRRAAGDAAPAAAAATPCCGGAGGPLAGGKQTFFVAVQGRLKRPVMASNLVSGQEFPRGTKSPSFMHYVFAGASKVFASTHEVHVREAGPMFFTFPVLAAAQLLNVSRPCEAPPLLRAEEDTRLFAPELSTKGGGPAPAERRRRFFDVPANLEGRVMGTEHVWTLHMYQSFIDFSTYKLGLAGVPVAIDLVSLLGGQPLQIMAKDKESGGYLFDVLVWNERLAEASAAASRAAAAATAPAGGPEASQPREGAPSAPPPAPDAPPAPAASLKGRFKGLLSGW